MAIRYLYRTDSKFQYKVDNGKPFYTALVNQGYTADASRHATKTIFPGGKGGASGDTYTPVY